jgi:hypothetical protein
MFLLAESCCRFYVDGRWLISELDQTPLSRIQNVFDQYGSANFAPLLDVYGTLHARFSDRSVRRELIELATPRTPEGTQPAYIRAYSEIHDLSGKLMSDLTALILMWRDDWPLAIFRNWLL